MDKNTKDNTNIKGENADVKGIENDFDIDKVEESTIDGTIENDNAGNAAAAGGTAEDTAAELQKVIDAQNKHIENLMKATESLQSQISVLLRNGASITDAGGNVEGNTDPHSYEPAEEYTSLSDLGAQIGTRRYENVNQKE